MEQIINLSAVPRMGPQTRASFIPTGVDTEVDVSVERAKAALACAEAEYEAAQQNMKKAMSLSGTHRAEFTGARVTFRVTGLRDPKLGDLNDPAAMLNQELTELEENRMRRERVLSQQFGVLNCKLNCVHQSLYMYTFEPNEA